LTLAVLSGDVKGATTLLSEIMDGAVSNLSMTQHLGDVYAGGRSNPVWALDFNLDEDQETKLILKITSHEEKPSSDRKRVLKQSFLFETQFYVNFQRISKQIDIDWDIPVVYNIESTSRTYSILMENLSVRFPFHIWPAPLETSTATLAMQWLANFHASFWGNKKAIKDLHVWEKGCFWLHLPPPQGAPSPNWGKTMQYVKRKNAILANKIAGLPQTLESMRQKIDQFFNIARQKNNVTLLHGDFKAANMFFNDNNAGVCDFQFVGGGFGASEVMYFIAWDYFHIENELKEMYFSFLSNALGWKLGSYDFEEFQRHYSFSVVAFFIYHFQKGWAASTNGDLDFIERVHEAAELIA